MSALGTYTDNQLLELLLQGSEEALTEIYGRYWAALIEIGFKFTSDKQAVEEIVNDIFLKLWANPEKFQVRSLPAYFHTAIKYGVFTMLLKTKRRKALLKNYQFNTLSSEEEQRIEAKFMEAYLNEIIETLPAKSRLIYTYSRQDEMSIADISEKMNMKTKAIEYHITKTLKLLRSALEHAHNPRLLLIALLFIKNLF